MSVGSRVVFMRFTAARSPKLQLWASHFAEVVGRPPVTVGSRLAGEQESIVVWHVISANNRMLARSADLYERFEDARVGALAARGLTTGREIVLTSHKERGEYGWYATADENVEMVCSRWYRTERDRHNAIVLAEASLHNSELSTGARAVEQLATAGSQKHHAFG
jgi:hypothetical protein